MGDLAAALVLAQEGAHLAHKFGFTVWECAGEFLIALIDGKKQKDSAAIEKMFASLQRCKAVGNSLSVLDYTIQLGLTLAEAGRLDKAQALAVEARAEIQRRIESSDEVWLRKLEAELSERSAALAP